MQAVGAQGKFNMLFGIEWDISNNWAFAWSILPILLKGLIVTIQATLVGFVVALILGLLLAALKGARLRIISWPAYFITEFIRDTPLLVQLFFLYYVLPEYGIILPAFMTGALALASNIAPIRQKFTGQDSNPYRMGKLRPHER